MPYNQCSIAKLLSAPVHVTCKSLSSESGFRQGCCVRVVLCVVRAGCAGRRSALGVFHAFGRLSRPCLTT